MPTCSVTLHAPPRLPKQRQSLVAGDGNDCCNVLREVKKKKKARLCETGRVLDLHAASVRVAKEGTDRDFWLWRSKVTEAFPRSESTDSEGERETAAFILRGRVGMCGRSIATEVNH